MKPKPSQRWKKIQRRSRLDKIKHAQRTLEVELLSLRAMYGPETDACAMVNQAFGQLYYLIRLAKKA